MIGVRPLPVKIGDCLVHLPYGALAHLAPVVQHPVDGSFTQPGLHGYLADPVRMRHGCSWRFFGGFLALARRFLILG